MRAVVHFGLGRQAAQQAGQVLGFDDGDTVGLEPAVGRGELGAVDGDDRVDGAAESLGGLLKEICRGRGAKAILMYSPSCRTVWVLCEVIRPEDTGTKWGGSVNRNSDGAQQKCTHRSGTNEKYSNMLNDAGVTSWGFVYAYIDPYEFSATTRSY